MNPNTPDSEYWSKDDIPDEIRAGLKTVYADPDPGRWDWDEGTWRWELSLCSDEYGDAEGYVYIAPCKNGEPFQRAVAPDLWHYEWLIGNIFPRDIYINGNFARSQECAGSLLFAPTPAIPLISSLTIQTSAPEMSAEEFKSLIPGDLIRYNGDWIYLVEPFPLDDVFRYGGDRIFLVEHVLLGYPTPSECRIYVRRQGGGDHGKQMMFQLADRESLHFSRRVRKPLPVLQELIRRVEQKEEPGYDLARSIGISRAQVDGLRDTAIKRPELIPALLDGILSLDDICYSAGGAPEKSDENE